MVLSQVALLDYDKFNRKMHVGNAIGLYTDSLCIIHGLIQRAIAGIGMLCIKLLATPNNAGNTGFCRTYFMECFEGTDLDVLRQRGEMVVYVGRLLVCINYVTLIYHQYQQLNGLYPIFSCWFLLNCLKEFVTI